jgi:hypothetical protein
MSSPRGQRVLAGLTLIVIGLLLFALNRVEAIGPAAVVVVCGLLLLGLYLMRRQYAVLIPACLLLGGGGGSLGQDMLQNIGSPLYLGLGAGFVAVYLIALVVERCSHWWPLIPGVILIVSGLHQTELVVGYLFDNWPLLLVIIGVIVILSSLSQERKRRPAATIGAPRPPSADSQG